MGIGSQVGQVTETRGALGYGFSRRFRLTNEEVINLGISTLLLVPAPGPDAFVSPTQFTATLDPWFANYTVQEGFGSPFVDFPTGAWASAFGGVAMPLAPGHAQTDINPWLTSSLFFHFTDSDVFNQPLGLFIANNNLPLGGGDPRNVMTVRIDYILLP